MRTTETELGTLETVAWVALEGAFDALAAGGLPCGAAISDATGQIVARGRNHAYDPVTGSDVLEGTPVAHAELNALARVPTSRDLSGDILWSTQQPCAMCTSAIEFCGVGDTRYLAADPAFIATDDTRAGPINDPTRDHPELTVWAILANALFLQPSITRGDTSRLDRNNANEPETVAAAESVAAVMPIKGLPDLISMLATDLEALAHERVKRMASTKP